MNVWFLVAGEGWPSRLAEEGWSCSAAAANPPLRPACFGFLRCERAFGYLRPCLRPCLRPGCRRRQRCPLRASCRPRRSRLPPPDPLKDLSIPASRAPHSISKVITRLSLSLILIMPREFHCIFSHRLLHFWFQLTFMRENKEYVWGFDFSIRDLTDFRSENPLKI